MYLNSSYAGDRRCAEYLVSLMVFGVRVWALEKYLEHGDNVNTNAKENAVEMGSPRRRA
jgi:hypothetical protein